MSWDDLRGENYPTSDWWQYSRTKLMDLMAAKEMARRLAGTGIEVFCAHPGLTRTDHFGKADVDAKWSSRGVEAFANSFWGTDAHTGALPLMFACTEPRLKGRTGAYIGSPELGPVNYFQTGEIRRPNAPLARDPWACRRLMDASLLILKEVDPELADNKWADISPDGQVLVDQGYASKVLPADGTSGTSTRIPLGPKTGGVAIWHDAAGVTGRTASNIGRRPAPFLALFRRLLMSAPADV